LPPRKLVLDTNCFIDASKSEAANASFDAFCAQAAPRLHGSSVVAAELRAGAADPSDLRQLEQHVLRPYFRRDRVVTPSAAAWEALGTTLATLVREDGLQLRTTPRSFVFDILISYSCRENGAILVSANTRDLHRIARVFAFDFIAPFPDLAVI